MASITKSVFVGMIAREGCLDSGNGYHSYVADAMEDLMKLIVKDHVKPTVNSELESGHGKEFKAALKLIEKKKWQKAVEEFFSQTGRSSVLMISEDGTYKCS